MQQAASTHLLEGLAALVVQPHLLHVEGLDQVKLAVLDLVIRLGHRLLLSVGLNSGAGHDDLKRMGREGGEGTAGQVVGWALIKMMPQHMMCTALRWIDADGVKASIVLVCVIAQSHWCLLHDELGILGTYLSMVTLHA